jgi:hypothetical protein
MFNTPLAEIDFAKVESFCKEWPEGIRVDYKVEPANIPKVISSFANTSGGIWIIGVKTDARNMPVFPLCGYPSRPGLEEQITQSSFQGIYPGIIPAVKVVPMTSDPSKVLIVVKVLESIEAPHAIENSTRVFIRVNSTSDHVTLADIDRIEYLLSRRRDSEHRREKLLQRASGLSKVASPKLRVEIGPRYPHGQILDLGRLNEIAHAIESDHKTRIWGPHTRLVQHAMVNTSSDGSTFLYINLFGQWRHEASLRIGSIRGHQGEHFDLVDITVRLASFIRSSSEEMSRLSANLLLSVSLEGIRGRFIVEDPATVSSLLPSIQQWIEDHTALEDSATAEINVASEGFRDELTSQVVELVRQLMWAFNWADDRVKEKVLAVLKANRFI